MHRKFVWFRLTAFGVVGPLDLPPRSAMIHPYEAEVLSRGRK